MLDFIVIQMSRVSRERAIQSFYSVATWVRKTMDSSEEEELFITQSSTKGDISAEIEGNVV